MRRSRCLDKMAAPGLDTGDDAQREVDVSGYKICYVTGSAWEFIKLLTVHMGFDTTIGRAVTAMALAREESTFLGTALTSFALHPHARPGLAMSYRRSTHTVIK